MCLTAQNHKACSSFLTSIGVPAANVDERAAKRATMAKLRGCIHIFGCDEFHGIAFSA